MKNLIKSKIIILGIVVAVVLTSKGVVYANMALPQYELCGTLETTVMYNNGKFTLAELKLNQNRLLPM